MANLEELEKRIRVLEDIEAIKELKAKYFHSIDRKRWNELRECFTKDGIWESARIQANLQGADAIVQFLKSREGSSSVVTAHQGHNPEIEFTSDTTAKGLWELNYYRDDYKENTSRRSASFYEDDYVKESGQWKIKHLRLVSIYSNESKMEY